MTHEDVRKLNSKAFKKYARLIYLGRKTEDLTLADVDDGFISNEEGIEFSQFTSNHPKK